MLKRLWVVLSILWSGLWIFLLAVTNDWHPDAMQFLNTVLFISAPWILGPVAFAVIRWVIRGRHRAVTEYWN